jgi:hypothetical protein
MNESIKRIFDVDQQDCLNQPANDTPEYQAMKIRNKHRRDLIKSIIESDEELSGEDYFHSCIIFLHGDCPEDFWQAYHFGLKSIELNFIEAKKYTASAYDRWLMYQGKPQKYGLQYVPDGKRLRVWDINPDTTDEERAEWDVPPLSELYNNAAEASKRIDMSKISMENKPQWLKDAVKRWNSEDKKK